MCSTNIQTLQRTREVKMDIEVFGPNWGQPFCDKVARQLKGAICVMSTKLGIGHEPINYEILLGRTINKLDGDCRGWASAQKFGKIWSATIFVAREENFSDMLSTLAHELIHVKQFIKDGLDVDKGMFKGRRWNARKKQDEDVDSPWEREAYGKEVALLEYYLNYVGKNS